MFRPTFALLALILSAQVASAKSGVQSKFCQPISQTSGPEVTSLLVFPSIYNENEGDFDLVRTSVKGVDGKEIEFKTGLPNEYEQAIVDYKVTKAEVVTSQESTEPTSSCEPPTYLINSKIGLEIDLGPMGKVTGEFKCVEDGYGAYDSSENCEE